MNGFINLLKPSGLTSHSAVSAMRRITKFSKIGHTGTLDPMATGVLPICFGAATRLTEYMDTDFKTYRCEMLLGKETDTQDIWGSVLNEGSNNVPENNIIEAFESFKGKQSQFPPKYSAVRVNGRRLYEYARQGEDVEIKPREIMVNSISIIRINGDRILFDVECSKGTYIRAICNDIGKKLGTYATMSFLARTASGRFKVENTVTFEEIVENGIEKYLLPIDYPLEMLGIVNFNRKDQGKTLINGGWVRNEDMSIQKGEVEGIYKIYCQDKFLAIGTYNSETNQVVPSKVLVREEL